jgi:copper chaperone CopZ
VSRRGFTVRAAADDDSVEIALKVEGMMCDGCASSVTIFVSRLTSVDVNLETKMVTVAVKAESAVAGLTLMPALVDAVKGAGFDAEPEF